MPAPGVLIRDVTADVGSVDDCERRLMFCVSGIVSGSTVKLESSSDNFDDMSSKFSFKASFSSYRG